MSCWEEGFSLWANGIFRGINMEVETKFFTVLHIRRDFREKKIVFVHSYPPCFLIWEAGSTRSHQRTDAPFVYSQCLKTFLMRNLLHEQVSKKTYCSVSLDMLAQTTGTTAEGNGQVLKNICNFLLKIHSTVYGVRTKIYLDQWLIYRSGQYRYASRLKARLGDGSPSYSSHSQKSVTLQLFWANGDIPGCEDLCQHNTLRGLVMKQLNCLASKVIVHQKICRQDGAKFFILIIFKTSFFDYRLLHHVSCKLQTYKKIYICILSFLYIRLQWAESGLRNINNILHIRLLAKWD